MTTALATAVVMAAMPAAAQPAPAPAPPAPEEPAYVVDFSANASSLTEGLPRGQAYSLRLLREFEGGHLANAEVLSERKFGTTGGLFAAGYTRVLGRDWILSGTLAAGHGGPNWANRRIDVAVAIKWLERQTLVTNIAAYHGSFDNNRSDRGVRLSVVGYLPATVVLEGGVIVNVSNPGSVNSRMPFISATIGAEGIQYLSARVASGTEAYQALGSGQQLVNFRSRSLGVNWRRWLSDDWGITVTGEAYHNPSYERVTLGAGLFSQF